MYHSSNTDNSGAGLSTRILCWLADFFCLNKGTTSAAYCTLSGGWETENIYVFTRLILFRQQCIYGAGFVSATMCLRSWFCSGSNVSTRLILFRQQCVCETGFVSVAMCLRGLFCSGSNVFTRLILFRQQCVCETGFVPVAMCLRGLFCSGSNVFTRLILFRQQCVCETGFVPVAMCLRGWFCSGSNVFKACFVPAVKLQWVQFFPLKMTFLMGRIICEGSHFVLLFLR